MIKRITGETLTAALDKVTLECGKDALIFSTEKQGRGYVVVASPPPKVKPKAKKPAITKGRKWTRGFRPIAQRGAEFGLSTRILTAIEDALIGTRVSLSAPGDPALPGLAAKVLGALLTTVADGHELPDTRVCALVGSTGVGKTTTLAKLAARQCRERGESIAIVSLDTYRVAAVEQLRAFADMLDVPFTIAFTPQDLRRAIGEHAALDRVFIDTTGRGPYDRANIEKLRATLQAVGASNLLCMPANLRRRDALLTLHSYRNFVAHSVLMTKWDETNAPGECMSVIAEQGLCLSHVTVGQEIPDDIMVADSATLAAAALALEEKEMEAVS